MRRLIVSTVLSLAMVVISAMPALAYVEEGGYKNCGNYIAYTHARFTIDAWIRGPGSPVIVFHDYVSGWHTDEENGGYSGNWLARGEPSLDLANTYAACRPYG